MTGQHYGNEYYFSMVRMLVLTESYWVMSSDSDPSLWALSHS